MFGGGATAPPHLASIESRVCQVFCEIVLEGAGFNKFSQILHKSDAAHDKLTLPTKKLTLPTLSIKSSHSIYLALRRKRQRFTLAPIPKATKLVTLSKASSILSVLLRHKRLTCSLPCLISVRKDIILPPHTPLPRVARHNCLVTRPLG